MKRFAFLTVFLSYAGTELGDFCMNRPGDGEDRTGTQGLDEAQKGSTSAGEEEPCGGSRTWRSLKTTLLNSTCRGENKVQREQPCTMGFKQKDKG